MSPAAAARTTAMTMPAQPVHIRIADDASVSGLWQRPPQARACFVFAHGAGAGMTHAFMAALAEALAQRHVATLRFQFPFVERGAKRPDAPAVAHAAVRAAVAEAARRAPDLPLFAGGKSFGGRMTSQAQAAAVLPGVRGLAFVGFPLHPAGKPGDARAAHLADVRVPMLFLQGTRDALADLRLLEAVALRLAPRARLAIVDDADHAFHVRVRSGRTNVDVVDALAATTAAWMREVSVRDAPGS
jgi:hypothetical protein